MKGALTTSLPNAMHHVVRRNSRITVKSSDDGVSETTYAADPFSLWKHPRPDCDTRGLGTSTEWLAAVRFNVTVGVSQQRRVVLAWQDFSFSPKRFLFPTTDVKDVNWAGKEST